MQIAINIPNDKVQFMLDMFSNLSFVRPESVVVSDDESTDGDIDSFLNGIETSFDDVNAHINGRKKLKSAWELVNEL